jgi:hypothetical protein|tara:strand:- start:1529 stop:1654 length:126 start_codon:yes stop_codon:yes gene_type:complete
MIIQVDSTEEMVKVVTGLYKEGVAAQVVEYNGGWKITLTGF